MMQYFELKCTAYLKQEIHFFDTFEVISKYISYSMCQDVALKALHNEYKAYNNYCFGGFFPREKKKFYKRGATYSFELRSIDEKLIVLLESLLRKNINNPFMLVVQTQKRVQKQRFLTEIYSATPTIITSGKEQNGKPYFWTTYKDGDILKLQEQLHNNLVKKYEYFYKQTLASNQNFIQLLELKNEKPQMIKLTNKNGDSYQLFGNKFRIVPNEDETSQKLAFLSLGVGLGEKSSFGAGFCVGKGKDETKKFI